MNAPGGAPSITNPAFNSFKVCRDITVPEDLYERPAVSEIAATLGADGRLELPDISLISSRQSIIAMRGGPTLQKLFALYETLAETVNELNAVNPTLEGQLGELALLGNLKARPGIRRYVGFMLAGELSDQLVADDHKLREAVGLKIMPHTPHATIFQTRYEDIANRVISELVGVFEPDENIIFGKAYIKPAYHPGYQAILA